MGIERQQHQKNYKGVATFSKIVRGGGIASLRGGRAISQISISHWLSASSPKFPLAWTLDFQAHAKAKARFCGAELERRRAPELRQITSPRSHFQASELRLLLV